MKLALAQYAVSLCIDERSNSALLYTWLRTRGRSRVCAWPRARVCVMELSCVLHYVYVLYTRARANALHFDRRSESVLHHYIGATHSNGSSHLRAFIETTITFLLRAMAVSVALFARISSTMNFAVVESFNSCCTLYTPSNVTYTTMHAVNVFFPFHCLQSEVEVFSTKPVLRQSNEKRKKRRARHHHFLAYIRFISLNSTENCV